ncbi:MAG: redox-regulated ATPase YchF [Bacteroidales bacterium]
MGLSCGIVGLTNTGKSTIFNCFSNTKAEITNYTYSSTKSNLGMVKVPDQRLKELEKLQPTERLVQVVVDIVDLPGLAKGASQGEGVGNKFLADLRNTDAIIHVLRCFDDNNLPHVEGSVNPVRDIEILDFELQVSDLESVDKRLAKNEKLIKTGDKEVKKVQEILLKIKAHLEELKNVRTLEFTDEEKAIVNGLFLLTTKPVLYVCNVDDSSAVHGNKYVEQVREFLKDQNPEIMVIAAKIESEIAELGSEEEQMEFLQDVGLTEPGVNKLIRAAYKMLKLETFFTVGPKEIRAWTIKKGATAPEAAGVIHSDLQRGFIRAEVMKYKDFIELKSETACKNAGKLHIEGKKYIVEDGDILNIRFNV